MTRKKPLPRCPYLVRFAYHGDKFFGVQEQRNLTTVLGAIRARIEDAAGQKALALVVTARTDKGVSALKNYATFYIRPPVDKLQFIADASRARSDGLFAVDFASTSPKTHARSNPSAKIYRYTIKDSVYYPREVSCLVWEIVPTLSIAAMQFAALDFIGQHDFSSMRGGGCEAGSTVKTVIAITIKRTSSGIIVIDIEGKGFLRKMVRNMVGLLVEIGAGLRAFDSVDDILKAKSREAGGIMAPAHGLLLRDITMREIL